MIYAVSEEGVSALRKTSSTLTEAWSGLFNLSVSLQTKANEHPDALGPHRASLLSALSSIYTALKEAGEPIKAISDALNDTAEAYQDIIDNDRLTQNHQNEALGGTPGNKAKGGLFGAVSRVFSGDQASRNGEDCTFDGLPTGKLNNGDSVIKGEHFEQFLDEYYRSEESSVEHMPVDTLVSETVSPTLIENIHLGETEVSSPNVFWGMHNSSKEFFTEAASHIPAVQERLQAGATISELKNDPTLGTCAAIYFDPEKMVRVEKVGSYYSFDGDGRHRILAARELGHSIPVRVVRIRTY